jgi:hypothetical protein
VLEYREAVRGHEVLDGAFRPQAPQPEEESHDAVRRGRGREGPLQRLLGRQRHIDLMTLAHVELLGASY